MFGIWFNAEAILLALKQDPEVARLAAVYLKWASLGLPAYAFNCISRRYFQCQGQSSLFARLVMLKCHSGYFAVPTQIVVFVAPINIALNYLLVWGPDPLRLGFIGAPIATAISFNLISLLSFAYGVFLIPRTAWSPLSMKIFTNLGVLVRLGLAGVGQTATEWWAWELAGLAASLLGPVTLAAQSVLIVSSSCTYQAPYALSVATSVRIGNLLGEFKARRAAISARTALMMGLVMAAFMSTLFILLRRTIGRLFNDDEEVISLVASIIPLVALYQVFDFESAIASGVLRACGKQAISALYNVIGYYVIGVPLGILLAFPLKMDLFGIWIALTIALVWDASCGLWISLRTDWDKEISKVLERLEDDPEQNHKKSDPECPSI
ncbi:hypothetical protein HGRIS_000389 [Hohenbuehelia grisea]|uniref:Multidrug and toxin extrusion protein n=1 Tax=Hohenbuehelia grisea TaxID=104357 RepID=A0ABR3JSB3_9AGAR